jgi:3-oxo-4-pregnene-20-carboxyl-CoA dehydrogenase alpha subunit
MMDFTPSDSQQAVATLAAEVLTAADPWKELAQAGLLDVSPPDGLSVLDTTTLLTEIGRHAPQEAMKALATLMTGAVPVARWGDDDLKQALLPAVASGELLLTASRREASLGAAVSGTATGVWHAAEAHRVLVPVSSGVVLIDPRSEGVTLTRTPASSGQPEYALRMDHVRVAGMLSGSGCRADLQNLGVRPHRRRRGRGARPDPGPRRDPPAVRPAAGRLPGGLPADRRGLHRVPDHAPGHAVGLLAAERRS